jgi:translocation and assembly module TamB
MRRKLLVGAISVLSLILILIAAAIFFIRSGRLDLFLQNQVVAALAEVGIRAEIGSTHIGIRGYRVSLDNMKLYSGDSQKPFGTVDSLEAQFSVASYLRREINITQVEVKHPEIWVAYDEQGRSNLADIHATAAEKEKKGAVTFLTANVEVTGGVVHYDDLSRKVSAYVPDLSVKFKPREAAALKDEINHQLAITFDKANATYDGRKIDNIRSSLEANVLYLEGKPEDQRAEVTRFEFESDLGKASASARVESFDPFRYAIGDGGLEFDANLQEIARVFMPDTPMRGGAKFKGSVNGAGNDYHVKGALSSDSLTAAGVGVSGLSVQTSVDGKGLDYHATGDIESGSVTAEGFRVAGVRVKTDVNGKGAEYSATADLSSGAITGRDLAVSSVRLSNATVKGKDDNFDLAGGLNVASLKSGRVTVNGLRGRLSADRDRVSLDQFTAGALGGNVSGSATIAYAGGSSRVDVQFKSIDLDQASALASAKDVKVRGAASGSARLAFPGVNYQAATGRIDATFNASASPPQSAEETLPATGQVSLVATGRGFNIERAFVRSAASEISVAGSVGWNGAGALNVNFKSQDMAEVQRVIDAFGLIPDDVKDRYEVTLAGAGEFAGRVEGRLASPNLAGHLALSSIQSHNEEVGSFEGDVSYSPSAVKVADASLTRPDGSRADFSLNAPLVGEDNISIKANVQNFDLATIARTVSFSLGDFVGRGTVNGTIDLRGLPGPRTIEGTASLSLSAGEFNLPGDGENGEDTRKISVPEFAGNITITNSVLGVENLRMRVGGSDIAGRGSFNLDTYAYSVDAEGKNIDLATVADAVHENLNVTGTADLKVAGQGKWGNKDDWSDANLNATIQGKNVAFNGRDLGDAKVVAFTDNGLLKVEATGNVLDQTRTLAATIDLRDRKNYPVNAAVEFTDTDIGPYLSLIAPGLAGISGRATGTIKVSGPLLDTDRIQAVANLSKLEFGGAISETRRYTITNQGDIVVTASPQGVSLDRVMFVGEGTSVTLEGTISREGGSKSNLAVNGEVNLRLLSSFTQTLFTTGVARVDASIVGSLASPQLLGVVTLRDIGVRVVDFPLSVARGNGRVRFTANQAVVENFRASAPGGGSIAVTGGAALAGLVPERWRVEVRADQVGVEYPRDTQTVIDAQLALQGNRRLQVVTGNVEVRRASYTRDISLDELITGGPFSEEFFAVGPGSGGGGGGIAGLPTTLDIRITADNTLVVKNNLADAVGNAYLTVRGSVDEPAISGRVQLTRGTLEFRRGRFEISRGLITLPGRRGADPVVDFQSEADISGYHVTVAFSGPLPRLQTTVRSDPELPETDIISLVLTGNVSADRTVTASVTQTGLGLAQSLLSASLSEQLERGTQRLFGLSRFSIDPLLVGRGSDPTARITIGQRITKDLTVTYSQNLTSGPSGIDRVVLVEYRISNRFSVVGYRNERGELGFDVRLRKRF